MPELRGMRKSAGSSMAGAAGKHATASAGAAAAAGAAARRGVAGAVVAGAVKVKAVAAAVLFAFSLAVPVTLAWSNYTQAALNEALGSATPGEGTLVVEKAVDSGELEIPEEYGDGLYSFTVEFSEDEDWEAGDPSVADSTWRIVDADGEPVPEGGTSGTVVGEGGSGTVGAGLSVSFKLRDGQRCAFDGVPEGATWQATEVGVNETAFEIEARGATGMMDSDGEQSLFTNRYRLGQVDVGKSVSMESGSAVPDSEYLVDYEFEYEFLDADGHRIELPGCVPSDPYDVDDYAALARDRALAALASGDAAGAAAAPDISEREVADGAGLLTVQSGDVALVQQRGGHDGDSELVRLSSGASAAQDGLVVADRDAAGSSSASSSAFFKAYEREALSDPAGMSVGEQGASAIDASESSDEGPDGLAEDDGAVADGSEGDAEDDGDAGADDPKVDAPIPDTGEQLPRFSLKPGQHVSFKGLPEGVSVHIREIVTDDAAFRPEFQEKTIPATARVLAQFTFRNVIDDVEEELPGGFVVGKQVTREDGAELTDAQASERFEVAVSVDAQALIRAGLIPGVSLPNGDVPVVVPDGTRVSIPVLMLGASEAGALPTADELDAAWAAWRDPANELDPETGRLVDRETRAEVALPYLPNASLELTVSGGMATGSVNLAHGERIVVWGIPSGAAFDAVEHMTEAQSNLYTCTSGDFKGGAVGRELPTASFANVATDERVDVPVEKAWLLASDLVSSDSIYAGFPDADIPGSVKVTLFDGAGEEADSCLLTAEGSWRHVFSGLPAYDSTGARVQYSVVEDAVEGFVSEVSGSMSTGFTVTNSQDVDIDPVMVELPYIEKVVAGDDVPEGTPFSFEVRAIDGAPLPQGDGVIARDDDVTCAVRILGAGTHPSGKVKLERPGTYRYEVREQALGFEGWLYDTAVHEVVVEVTLSEGALVASIYIDGESIAGDGVSGAGSGSIRFENTFDPDAVTITDLIVTMEVQRKGGLELEDHHLAQEFMAEIDITLPEGASSHDRYDELAAWVHERFEGEADDTEEETRTLRYLLMLEHEDANRAHHFGEHDDDEATARQAEAYAAAPVAARELTAIDAALESFVSRGSFGTTGDASSRSSGPVAVYDASLVDDVGIADFEEGEDGRLHAKLTSMLKHGERLHVYNLPLGTEFTVTHATHDNYPAETYSPNITLAVGSVPDTDTRHVRLINSPLELESEDPGEPSDPDGPDGPGSGDDPNSSSSSSSASGGSGSGDGSDSIRPIRTGSALGQTGDAMSWVLYGLAAIAAIAAIALVISIRRDRRSNDWPDDPTSTQ